MQGQHFVSGVVLAIIGGGSVLSFWQGVKGKEEDVFLPLGCSAKVGEQEAGERKKHRKEDIPTKRQGKLSG